ncbi:MAG: 6-phosphogluconolactonase [Armatimonadota bacterium]|nr:6-phosphogluconolactonase [Armatimonadota bacterium]
MNREVIIFETGDEVAQYAAELFAGMAEEAVAARGVFTVALSGGSTPKTAYSLLAAKPLQDQVPWDNVQIFWGDERTVPPDHPDSNYRMAREAMLAHVPIPEANIHRMEGEAADLDASAASYEQTIRTVLDIKGGIPRFDLILLGMGDDGHTASLFPQTAALDETERLVVPNHVAKLNTNRITMTRPLLNNGGCVLFLAPGAAKAARLHEVLEGPQDWHRLPSQSIQPQNGRLVWAIDKGAAVQLTGNYIIHGE